jgi:hypothetical protein
LTRRTSSPNVGETARDGVGKLRRNQSIACFRWSKRLVWSFAWYEANTTSRPPTVGRRSADRQGRREQPDATREGRSRRATRISAAMLAPERPRQQSLRHSVQWSHVNLRSRSIDSWIAPVGCQGHHPLAERLGSLVPRPRHRGKPSGAGDGNKFLAIGSISAIRSPTTSAPIRPNFRVISPIAWIDPSDGAALRINFP